jgi:hypothetical protein
MTIITIAIISEHIPIPVSGMGDKKDDIERSKKKSTKNILNPIALISKIASTSKIKVPIDTILFSNDIID